MRAPGLIKKELVDLRGKLKRQQARLVEAAERSKKLDHMLNIAEKYEADMALRDARNSVEQTKRSIRDLEVELAGDWAPKAWGQTGE